jgi:ketosteroid isomerase-like protein
MNALEAVNTYFAILANKTGEGLAELVTDDVTFEGPFFQATGATEFLQGMKKWIQVPKTYHIHKQFVAGNETCSIYSVDVVSPAGEKIKIEMADWIELRDGKVVGDRVYFDPRAWAQALGRKPDQS